MSSPNQLSFLPDDYLDSKRQARTNLICAGLFLVVMVALGAVFTAVEKPLREAREMNEKANRRYAEAATPIEQFRRMQDKQKQVSQQAELTASLVERVPRSVLLAKVTNALPGGASLIDFALESKLKVAPPAGPPVPRTQFELKKGGADALAVSGPRQFDVLLKVTGMAYADQQVGQFMEALSRAGPFAEVNLVISDEFEHNKEKVRKFQLEMLVNPEAEVDRAPVRLKGRFADARVPAETKGVGQGDTKGEAKWDASADAK